MPGWHLYPITRHKHNIPAKRFYTALLNEGIATQDLVLRDASVAEWLWEKNPVIWFLESPEVCEFLGTSEFRDVSLAHLPNDPFPTMVSYPAPYGDYLGAALVTKCTVKQRHEKMLQFFRFCGYDKLTMEDFKDSGHEDEAEVFDLVFIKNRAHYRFTVPESKIEAALAGEWFDDSNAKYESKEPLFEEDLELEHRHLIMALRAFVYRAAFPDALVDGLPSKKQVLQKMPSGVKTFYFRKKIEHRSSPAIHYRSPHLRILKNERYKRDESGAPRVIPVSSALVGCKNVDAKTLRKFQEHMKVKVKQ